MIHFSNSFIKKLNSIINIIIVLLLFTILIVAYNEISYRNKVITDIKNSKLYEISYTSELGYPVSEFTDKYTMTGNCVSFISVVDKTEYVICNPISIKQIK